MKREFRNMRVKQLTRSLGPFIAERRVARPPKGWLRAIREASGIPLREVAERLHSSAQSVAQLEKSEAEYRITLQRLREVANAMDCDLVYVVIPRHGSIEALGESRLWSKAAEQVRSVEHSMALEDQAVGGVEAKIAEETKKLNRFA
jgi:predicted DNA-binding mobile mystery protein A